MYTLFTDRNESFSADVSVKNASLKNSTARLVVEADDITLVFKGLIENQKCTIPIKKLKGILEESARGKMYLEIIVEDIYFKPWESDFVVEEHTSMKVVVKEQEISDKPILEVKVVEPKKEVIVEKIVPVVKKQATVEKKLNEIALNLAAADELLFVYKKMGLTEKTHTKEKLSELMTEYFKSNQELLPNQAIIARDFLKKVGLFKSKR